MRDLWRDLPVLTQDLLILAGLLIPLILIGFILTRGTRPWTIARGILRAYPGVSAVFVALIAVSIAVGTAILAQERGLRIGSAQAADPFTLIVAAPGSDITAMLAAVYLQPSAIELLDGAAYDRIASHERVTIAAPIAFGDSWEGHPVVGTIAPFVNHLTGDLAEGRIFQTSEEAIAGAFVPIGIGEAFEPAHGHGAEAEDGAHAGFEYTVTGRMAPTGSPWDKAILVPVEGVWQVHGLADGHAEPGRIGPPFVPELFPGTPAVLVVPDTPFAAYPLRSEFTDSTMMGILPGAVLSRLHGLLGDVRQALSIMATASQALVATGVMAGLFILTRLLGRRLALLRALGAPRRFAVAVLWTHAMGLIVAGALIGLALGWIAARILGQVLTGMTDIAIDAPLGWGEVHLTAVFLSLAGFIALLPAWLGTRRIRITDLRA
ncbi:FtsX-like permease family protein [Aestuariibius sp. 2305UL40-4]|uniref:FtsX-like permease family protein n=1 Tax=Aestuariibius violaceus TaxID=3234132 RepID=UPI00345E8E7B